MPPCVSRGIAAALFGRRTMMKKCSSSRKKPWAGAAGRDSTGPLHCKAVMLSSFLKKVSQRTNNRASLQRLAAIVTPVLNCRKGLKLMISTWTPRVCKIMAQSLIKQPMKRLVCTFFGSRCVLQAASVRSPFEGPAKACAARTWLNRLHEVPSTRP